ncbi:MAG TPA: hypothetical protein VJ836_00515 [Candidatus Saccharimonadales bacterium]|nr:hypothetical protein [Candidatus Saccharimonadales bacterium]
MEPNKNQYIPNVPPATPRGPRPDDWQRQAVEDAQRHAAIHSGPVSLPQQPFTSPQPGISAEPQLPQPGVSTAQPTSWRERPAPAPVPTTPSSWPDDTAPPPPPPQKTRRSWKLLLLLIAVPIIIGLAVAIYFLFFAPEEKNDTTVSNTSRSSVNEVQDAADMSILAMAVLNPPADMKDYKPKNTGVATVKEYNDPSGKCTLQFGTLPADHLPGKDIGEVVAPQLATHRNAGATVEGPEAGISLIVKDAIDESVAYSLPTLEARYTEGSRRVALYYSAAILTNGSRAFVNRSCTNDSGEVDQAALKAVNDMAKKITVTRQ